VGKLLRCGRCRNVWFCNHECQVVAARQGHSGANCHATDRTTQQTDATGAPRLPAAAGPSSTHAASSCLACGKSGVKLLSCGQCKNVWFCSRECQIVARKELGHRGANCRVADGAHNAPSSAVPLQASTPTGAAKLLRSYEDLIDEAHKVLRANTRIGDLAALENFKEAATVANLVSGAQGAALRAQADLSRSSLLFYSRNLAAAAQAACSSLRATRASGSRTTLVSALAICGDVATAAPGEVASAERES